MSSNEKIQSPGLVLREFPYKENHAILTILTATDGLITATAYGSRKSGSSLSAGTKLFNYSEFTLVESRGRYKVDSVKTIEQFFALSASIEGYAAASYFVEVLHDVSLAGQADTEVLRLALNALYALAVGKRPHRLIKAAFELRLMALSGFAPELLGCEGCGGEDAAYFNVTDAALYCARCGEVRRSGGEQLFPIHPSSIAAMRYILSAELPKLFSFSLGEEAAENLAFLCELFTREQMGRSYDSLSIYHSLCK
ncbi:MAG: DNA repair protein RecO [Ruminococcaceae bacterium]|nr:DNA repair protein RecO [Oscillospiraceae bacterium]